jgi:prepilin-type N-terminal cleavage/methylation domain-containing protein
LPHFLKARLQRGLSLLELSLSLAVLSVALAGLYAYTSSAQYQTSVRSQAQQFAPWVQAASHYIAAHRSQLIDSAKTALPTAADGEVYTVPAAVSWQQLQQQHLVSSALVWSLGNGQDLALALHVVKQGSMPGGWRVEGLLYTKGGMALSDADLGMLATELGARSGFVLAGKPNVIQGGGGAWSAPVSSWDGAVQPGHLALQIGAAGSGGNGRDLGRSGTWLSRTNEAGMNTMQTDLILPSEATEGRRCSGAGHLNSDGRQALVCQRSGGSLTWQPLVPKNRFDAVTVTYVTAAKHDSDAKDTPKFENVDRDMWVTMYAAGSKYWAINYGCSGVLSVKQPDGSWQEYSQTRTMHDQVANNDNKCSVAAFVPKGGSFKFAINLDFTEPTGITNSGREGAYITCIYSSSEGYNPRVCKRTS